MFGPAGPHLLAGGGQRVVLEVRAAKVEENSQFCAGGSGQIWSRTAPRGAAAGPSARSWSGAMIIGPIRLKLGRCVNPMGTWPHKCFGPVGPHLQGGGGQVVSLEVCAA